MILIKKAHQKIINYIFLVWLLLKPTTIILSSTSLDDLNIDIYNNNSKLELIEYINQGYAQIKQTKVEKNAIMILGLSGSGKSTLVNYLNNVPLICVRNVDELEWVIELENKSFSLPGGFNIGHSINSFTKFPASYTPSGQNFSYIDNPGFSDTRGIAFEIAHNAFRKLITENISDIKFLLLIKQDDLKDRAYGFRDSLRLFSSFLAIFDSSNATHISKSIGIIITRVQNKDYTDEELKKFFKKKARELIKSEYNDNVSLLNEHKLLTFLDVINNDQLEIFSNPHKSVRLDSTQKDQILTLIDKLIYIKKDLAKMRISINGDYYLKLFKYTNEKLNKLKMCLNDYANKSLTNYISEKKKTLNIYDLKNIYRKINGLYTKASRFLDLDEFLDSLNSTFFVSEIECFNNSSNNKQILMFFNNLLDITNQTLLKKQWLDDELINELQKFKNYLHGYFKIEHSKFLNVLSSTIRFSLEEFCRKKINDAINSDDLNKLSLILIDLKQRVKKEYDFETFSHSVLRIFFTNESLEKINSHSNPIIKFIQNLNNENYINEEKWFIKNGFNNFELLEDLISKVEKLNSEIFFEIFSDGVLSFTGHFLKISSLSEYLNRISNITDLRLIKIFSTQSFIFDEDFRIPNESYSTHSPDLIIISPKVSFIKILNVDLSCEKQPNYPNNKENAKNGRFSGNDGENGEEGEPGFNGGNLVIISNAIFNVSYLNFTSNAGYGGPGQNGGDGAEGKKGRDGNIFEVDSNEIIQSFKKTKERFICTNINANKCIYPCGCTFLSEKIEKRFEKFANYHSHYIADNVDHYSFMISGQNGSRGGKGGKGGVGGVSGLSGKKIIINYNDTFNHRIQQKQSSPCTECLGKNGLDGKNGKHGSNGNTYNTIFKIKQGPYIVYGDELIFVETVTLNNSNQSYEDKQLSENMKPNLKKPFKNQTPFFKFVNDYLKYSIDNKDEFLNKNFLFKVLSEEYFKFDPKELINRIKLVIDFDDGHFLKQINTEILDKIKNQNTNESERRVYNYLRAFLLSTIIKHNSLKSPHLVLDIKEYIELILEKIKNKDVLEKQNRINFYLSTFEDYLNEKINELNNSIVYLNENIFNLEVELFNQIASLASEIAKDKHELIWIRNKQENEKKKLENKLIVGQIISGLKIFAACLSFLGPKGAFLSGMAQIGLDMLDSKIFKEDSKRNEKPKSDTLDKKPSVKQMFNKMKEREKLGQKELSLIHNEIYKTNEHYDDLYKIESCIENLLSDINEYRLNPPKTNSLSMLEKFEIKTKYSSIRNHIHKIYKKINIEEYNKEIELNLNNLQNTIEILFKIYDRIENYELQDEFAKLQASIVKSETRFNLTDYDEVINDLKIHISTNLIQERYQIVLDAYKYWSFPYSCYENISQHEIKETNDINIYKTHLEAMWASVSSQGKIFIDYKKDNNLHSLNFIDESSFFIWSSKDYPFEVHNLLSGKRVLLYADVKYSVKDAVKFSSLYLQVYVEPRNGEVNKELQSLLNNYNVKLVYSGNSSFKFDNKIYSVGLYYENSLKLELDFHYGCKLGEKCDRSNRSFKKLLENKPLLSPYTYWGVMLVPVSNSTGLEAFKKIDKIISGKEVFVALVGHGEFFVFDRHGPSMDCLNSILKEDI